LWSLGFVVAAPISAQGLPFHTPSAMTTAFEERGLRLFAVAQSRGDLSVATTPIVVLPFAPHHRVTTLLSAPFVVKRLDPGPGSAESFSNRGIGDITASVKWAFFVKNRFAGTSRLALIASTRLPTGATDARLSGEPAPRRLQLGTGTAGFGATVSGTWIRNRWGLTAAVGRSVSSNDGTFQAGAATRYDIALGFRIPAHVETIHTRTLQVYIEWNGEVVERSRSAGASSENSGGHVSYLSPALQWVVAPQLMLEASVQVPMFQRLNGSQPSFGARPAMGLRYLFF
jgi:outer membrane putative beta-barrel porin/alpha-amylase